MLALTKAFDKLDWVPLLENQVVTEKANWLAEKTFKAGRSNRTREEVLDNCLEGTALEFAVFEALVKAGYAAVQSDDWSYDIGVQVGRGFYRLDVKGCFSSAQYINRTANEQRAGLVDVFYLGFDCRNLFADYLGWAAGDLFRKSNYNDGGYVSIKNLTKDEDPWSWNL